MGLMRVRVPAVRDMIELSRAEEVKVTMRMLDRNGRLPPNPKGSRTFSTMLKYQSILTSP